ncbi:carbohydrate-binding module family 35 protein [Aaosphaeria arxii CBS 175.79]|uniref:Alpha-galactosidase n=1 Tax=Aaosphaeria arxii CBS 175.79 TaxID=1450172 RepID=A0A6A5Y4Z4_9PLEO|nr:carbohydrate-binding module family 35 protein [Aaosphaeria arxii CBS 175.79]KAF2020339.1 carbohydrate-binding module family 35 protein [Aaosphaeria arxii CBS 175.79]
MQLLGLAFVLLSGTQNIHAQSFPKTPLLGWNSYNYLACSPNSTTIEAAIKSLSDLGFVESGYKYFQLDCGWASRDGQRNQTSGALAIDTQRFPNGLQPLSNLARSKGMKWSMYSDAGTRMCDTEVPSPVLGSLGHEAADAALFKSLNTEYVKYDNCYVDGPSSTQNAPKDPRTDFVTRFRVMWDHLQKVGIYGMLICQWGVPLSTSSGLDGPSKWTGGISTSFRLSDDIAQGWENVYRIYNQAIHIARSGTIGPGHVVDADMLEVGNKGMTFDEQATHFASWAMLKSALMISTNPTTLTPETIKMLQNKDLISINQDPSVKPIQLQQRWRSDRDLWAGDLSNGDRAVLLVDLSNTERTLTLHLSDIGIQSATIKDLWNGETVDSATSFSKAVKARGSAPLRLSNIVYMKAAKTEYRNISASSGVLSSGSNIQPCSGCLSGSKVGNLGGSNNGRLILTGLKTSQATQPVAFDYINCEIGYLGGSNNERLASISVNGRSAQVVSFPLSGYNWEVDVYRGFKVELSGFNTSGPNNITVSGVGTSWAPDLDQVGLIV